MAFKFPVFLAPVLSFSGLLGCLMAAPLALAAAQDGVGGSETRPIEAGVTQVIMSGPIDLNLHQSASPALQLRGDPKLLARVTTRIEGNTLYVGTRGIFISIGKSEQTQLDLALPALEKVSLQGSGDAQLRGFRGARLDLSQRGSGDMKADLDYQQVTAVVQGSGNLMLNLAQSDTLDLSMHGSGDVNLKAQLRQLNAKLTGSGDLNASNARVRSAELEMRGSGDVRVNVSDSVRGRLSGSGDLLVGGNPATRQIDKHGSGDVIWR